MNLTTVFIVPNAHHIFGSRHRISEFVVPSGIYFGGCWIAFLCFWESFASSGGVRGVYRYVDMSVHRYRVKDSEKWQGAYKSEVRGKGGETNQWPQMASRAKSIYLTPWI